MQRIGGNMKLTTWTGDGHNVAAKMIVGSDNGNTQLSSDRCDPEPVFLNWLLEQKKVNHRQSSKEVDNLWRPLPGRPEGGLLSERVVLWRQGRLWHMLDAEDGYGSIWLHPLGKRGHSVWLWARQISWWNGWTDTRRREVPPVCH